MRIRTILAAAAAPAALAAVLLGTAGQASAAVNPQGSAAAVTPKPVTYSANAHEANVADTTNVSGDTTQLDPNYGPVWAHDNLLRKLTATQISSGTWWVQIASQGSFSAFANPLDGNAWPGTGAVASDNTGTVKGNVNFIVYSANPPQGTNLDSQLPDTMRSGQIVAKWFKVDPNSDVSPVDYSFDYSPIPVPSDVAFDSGVGGISYGKGPNGLHYTQVG